MNLSIVGCASLSHAKQSMPKRKSSLNLQSHKLWAYCQKLVASLNSFCQEFSCYCMDPICKKHCFDSNHVSNTSFVCKISELVL